MELKRTLSKNAGLDADLGKWRIFSWAVEAQKLVDTYAPKIHNGNKKAVFAISCPKGSKHSGTINVSKWRELPLPQKFLPLRTQITIKSTPYEYNSSPENTMVWHVNFADSNLFFAYGGPLFAQDEAQVTEHPALASVREALLAFKEKDPKYNPYTRENGKSTPFLVRNVERRVAIATDANEKEGRPKGLYGNNFMNAEAKAVTKATKVIEPPTMSNIIAIAALGYQHGSYTHGQISDMFSTAYSSFVSAKFESQEHFQSKGIVPRVTIHTGYWGCGAFGGNRVLMSLIQLLAAHLAAIDELVFHTVNNDDPCIEAHKIFISQLPTGAGGGANSDLTVSKVLQNLVEMDFKWGMSDGN